MASVSVKIPSRVSQNSPQVPQKRPLSDTSDDESDRDELTRLRSTSIVSNGGATQEVSSKPPSEANKSRKKKPKKKKKRKLSVVEESARAEKSPTERLSQASLFTRPPSSKPPSTGPPHSDMAETRESTPAAGPSRSPRDSSTETLGTVHGEDITGGTGTVKEEVVNEDDRSLLTVRRHSTCISSLLSDNPAKIPKVDKGKAKASSVPSRRSSSAAPNSSAAPPNQVSPDAEASTSKTISDLQYQVSGHQNLLSNLIPSLTCRVCLYLMNRPFALAPCGHVVCHSCLVAWFSGQTQEEGAGAPPSPAAPAPAAGPSAVANDDGPAVPAGDVAAAQRMRRRSAITRKKTCPHCRAVVRERPAEVWGMKEMVASLVQSGLVEDKDVIGPATPDPPASEDPWKDIFLPKSAGPGNHAGNLGMDFDQPDMPLAVQQDLMGIQDDDDGGIYRCVDCMHEIWAGVCSNCEREYEGHIPWPFVGSGTDSEYDDDELDLGDDGDIAEVYNPNPGILRRLFGGGGWGAVRVEEDEEQSDDEEDEYGGSFIDDGEVRDHRVFDGQSNVADAGVDSDVEILDDPPRVPRVTRSRVRRAISPIIISSDDEDEHPRRRRSSASAVHPIFIPSDNEEEGDEEENSSEDDGDTECVSLSALERWLLIRYASLITATWRMMSHLVNSTFISMFLQYLYTNLLPVLRAIYGDDGSRPRRRSRYEAELSEIEHDDDEEIADYMDDGSEGRSCQWGDPGYEESDKDQSGSERSADDDDMYY